MLHCSTLSNLMSIVKIKVLLNLMLRKESDIFLIYVSSQVRVSLKLYFYSITRKQIVNNRFHTDLDTTSERINNFIKYPITVFKSVWISVIIILKPQHFKKC